MSWCFCPLDKWLSGAGSLSAVCPLDYRPNAQQLAINSSGLQTSRLHCFFFVVNYCQTMMNYSPSQQLGLSPRLKREFGRNLCLCTNYVSIKTGTIYIGQDTREHLAESDHFGSCERTLPWAHFGLCLEIRKVEKDNHHLCFDVFRHLDIHNY